VKKAYSLKGRRNFQELFKRGKRFSGADVKIIVRRGNIGNEKTCRDSGKSGCAPSVINIGITVGRKYGNAVNRNKAKRIIRAVCRDLIPVMREGYYIVIRPEPGFKMISFVKAKEEITTLLKKAGVLS